MIDFDKIETWYKNQGQTLETPPPADGWARIEASLNRPHRKALIYWGVSIAATLLALFFLSPLVWTPARQAENQMIAEVEVSATETGLPKLDMPLDNMDLTITKQEPVHESMKSRQKLNQPENNNKPVIRHESKADRPAIDLVSGRLTRTHSLTSYFAIDSVPVKPLKIQVINDPQADFYKVISGIQDPKESSPRVERKIEIGASYTPLYAYRQASNPPTKSYAMTHEQTTTETGLLRGAGGLRVNVAINKRWSVESGVRYAQLGQKTNYPVAGNGLVFTNFSNPEMLPEVTYDPLNNSMGIVTQQNSGRRTAVNTSESGEFTATHSGVAEMAKMEQNIDYLEIPMTLKYYLINRGITLSLSAGVSTNWLISNRVYLLEESKEKPLGRTDGISTITWSSNAGLALTVPLFKRVSLQFEPRINYFLHDINKSYEGSYRPYAFGVYSGVQYTLGK